MVRGLAREEPVGDENRVFISPDRTRLSEAPWAHKIVVTSDHEFVVIGVDALDRSGLLLDISKVLSRLKMNLRHTEASVVGRRSISIWRCELMDSEQADVEEIWSALDVSIIFHSQQFRELDLTKLQPFCDTETT